MTFDRFVLCPGLGSCGPDDALINQSIVRGMLCVNLLTLALAEQESLEWDGCDLFEVVVATLTQSVSHRN